MTTKIISVSPTQSAIQVNDQDALIIGERGIISGLGKNKIINGNFAINQRQVSGTVVLAAGAYGHDRWKAGAAGCTYTFLTALNQTTITITAGSLQQVISGVNLFSGPVVLGWTGTAQGKIDAGTYGASGVTGTAIGGTNMTVEFNTGTLSLVQLETGSVRSYFEQRLWAFEYELCRDYYRESRNYGAAWSDARGSDYSVWINAADFYDFGGKNLRGRPMQAIPVMVFYDSTSGTAGNVRNITGAATIAVTGSTIGQSAYRISTAAGTATNAASWHWSATAEL